MRTSEAPARTGADPATGSPVPPDDSAYWAFYEEVAAEQLSTWLPDEPQRVLDLSGGRTRFAEQLVLSGHEVVHVRADRSWPAPEQQGAGRVLPVVADARELTWVRSESVDAVLAESRALSMCLATEVTAEHLRRVLRPGGRLLLVVESLLLGLSRLADLGRWAELADVPSADVVLVPQEDGSITRCFWPEELDELLTGAGLEVEWVRPRTVLSPATVVRALEQGGAAALRTLVTTECRLAAEREGTSAGLHLVVSARRPAA